MKFLIQSIRFFLWMSFLCGVFYPLFVTGILQSFYPKQANGSLVELADKGLSGSELIAQGFKSEKYFWPRPSAVDYNPMPSGGSNLAQTSQDLVQKVAERRKQGVEGDMLFSSASGLDPHISPSAAFQQVERVAKARNIPREKLETLVKNLVESRQFGFLGEERVNVLKLNVALDAI